MATPAAWPQDGKWPPKQRESPTAGQGDARPPGEVPGYDTMNARAVITLVRDSDAATLGWIHDRESTHKQRVTVLRAVAARREAS